MAVELSKIYPIHEIPHRFQINKDRILFPGTDRRFHANRCSWRDDKAALYYCEKAKLKFEAFLPGNYLTRYSVQCPHCCKNEESCFHLYCSYCDEVLKGSIAKPSGKISDHVITIRHVYQQALAIKDCLERDTLESSNIFMSWKYIVKLAEWSERVRYSTQASVKQIHLDKVLKELNQLLERHRPPQALMMVRRSPAAPLLWKTLTVAAYALSTAGTGARLVHLLTTRIVAPSHSELRARSHRHTCESDLPHRTPTRICVYIQTGPRK